MTAADQLDAELKAATAALKPCPDCGGRCMVRYDPGCTYVVCINESLVGKVKTLLAKPDWCPQDAATAHNHRKA